MKHSLKQLLRLLFCLYKSDSETIKTSINRLRPPHIAVHIPSSAAGRVSHLQLGVCPCHLQLGMPLPLCIISSWASVLLSSAAGYVCLSLSSSAGYVSLSHIFSWACVCVSLIFSWASVLTATQFCLPVPRRCSAAAVLPVIPT